MRQPPRRMRHLTTVRSLLVAVLTVVLLGACSDDSAPAVESSAGAGSGAGVNLDDPAPATEATPAVTEYESPRLSDLPLGTRPSTGYVVDDVAVVGGVRADLRGLDAAIGGFVVLGPDLLLVREALDTGASARTFLVRGSRVVRVWQATTQLVASPEGVGFVDVGHSDEETPTIHVWRDGRVVSTPYPWAATLVSLLDGGRLALNVATAGEASSASSAILDDLRGHRRSLGMGSAADVTVDGRLALGWVGQFPRAVWALRGGPRERWRAPRDELPVDFSPDGSTVLSLRGDVGVALRASDDGRRLAEFEAPSGWRVGQTTWESRRAMLLVLRRGRSAVVVRLRTTGESEIALPIRRGPQRSPGAAYALEVR